MSRICIDARKIGDYGIGSYVSRLLVALAAADRGHDYLVLANPTDRDFVDSLGPSFRYVAATASEYSLRELLSQSWHLHRIRPDLYHAPHYVLPASVPCPAVVTVHDVIHLLFPGFLPNRIAGIYARFMIGRSLKISARIIAVSESTKEDLQRLYGPTADKVRVVYNGVDDVFRCGTSNVLAAEQLSSHGITEPFFLFVGNPKPHKNLDNLLRAWARAREAMNGRAQLVCVGAREGMPTRLVHLRQKLGLDDEVRFLGYVSDSELAALYRGAVALVHPSLYEGFGLPVAEAMASGTPVITSANSSLMEIAGDSAALVDPLDLQQLADTMAKIMGSEELRRELSRKGHERSKRFRWQRTAAETLSVYDEALQHEN